MLQPVKIQIRVDILRHEPLRLCKHRPVLRDHIMTAENLILSRFSFPRRGVNITRDQLRAGRLHQHFPIHILPHRLIGSRQVHQHRSSRQRMSRPRRQRRPQILAQLTAHRQAAHRIHCKQDVGSNGNLFSMKKIDLRLLIARHEMSGLIKLRIRGDIPLGNKSQHFAVLQHRRHIVELVADLQRQSHEYQRVITRRCIRHHFQRFPCPGKQKLLQEQIAAGVARNAKFRKYDDPGPFCIRFLKSFTNFARIIYRIRHPDLRRHRCCLNKSMSHDFLHFCAAARIPCNPLSASCPLNLFQFLYRKGVVRIAEMAV